MRMHAVRSFAIAAFSAAVSLSAGAQVATTFIQLPNDNVQGIAENPVTNFIYAVSPTGYPGTGDTVVVIDGKTDTITTSIPVPTGAYVAAVNILLNRVYVTSCDLFVNPTPCSVTVLDGKKNTVITTIPITTVKNGFLPGITVNPVTGLVYVADYVDKDIVILDGYTNTIKGTIALSSTPQGLAINPLNNKLYVTFGSDVVDIINASTKAIVATSTGANTEDFNVAVDLLTGHVFVTNTSFGSSTTAVLSQNGNLLATVPVGQAAFGVDVDPVTNLSFVADINDGNTSVVDGKTNTLSATIGYTYAAYVAVNPVTKKVYGAGSGMVTVAPE